MNELQGPLYHKDRRYVSSSQLKMLLSDPEEHYRRYILNEPQEAKDYYDFGTYIHALFLEPETVADSFVFSETLERKGPSWDRLVAENPSKTCLSKLQRQQAQQVYDLVVKAPIRLHNGQEIILSIKDLLTGGEAECTHVIENALCRGAKGLKVRCDYKGTLFGKPTIYDIKTMSDSLTMVNIRKVCEKYEYALSAAMYQDVVKQSTGIDHDFVFIFINKSPRSESDAIRVVKASELFLHKGRAQYMYAIHKYELAMKTNNLLTLMEV